MLRDLIGLLCLTSHVPITLPAAMQFGSTLGPTSASAENSFPGSFLDFEQDWCHCRQHLESKVSSLQVELDASSDKAAAAHASKTEMHASMAAQQTELQQMQADLSTVTAAR